MGSCLLLCCVGDLHIVRSGFIFRFGSALSKLFWKLVFHMIGGAIYFQRHATLVKSGDVTLGGRMILI